MFDGPGLASGNMTSLPADPSRVWTPAVVRCIASFLPPNEVACTLRLVDSATAAQFADDDEPATGHQHHHTHNRGRCTVVRLSQPVPHHAFAAHWTRPGAFTALSRLDRQLLLRLTARSGCVDNLRLAMGLVPDWNIYVDLVHDAASAGSLECAQLARECGHAVIGHPTLKAAAEAGNRELCEWLLRERLAHDRRSLAGWAAQGGHEALMRHFLAATANCCDALGVDTAPNTQLLEGVAHGLPLGALQRLYGQQFGVGGSRTPALTAAEAAAAVAAAAAAVAAHGGNAGGLAAAGAGAGGEGRGLLGLAYGGRGAAGGGGDGGRGGAGGRGPRVEVCEELECLAALLAAAAGSPTPDWWEKLLWLEEQLLPLLHRGEHHAEEEGEAAEAEGRRRLGPKARLAVMCAAAEAPWGVGARLRRLHGRGYEMEEELLLKAGRALRGNLDALGYCLEVLCGGGGGDGGGGGGGSDCKGAGGNSEKREGGTATFAGAAHAEAVQGLDCAVRAAAGCQVPEAAAAATAAAAVKAASAGLQRCSRELWIALERLARSCALDGYVGALELLRQRGLLRLPPPERFLKELVGAGTLQSVQWVVARWQEQEQAQAAVGPSDPGIPESQARTANQGEEKGGTVQRHMADGRRQGDAAASKPPTAAQPETRAAAAAAAFAEAQLPSGSAGGSAGDGPTVGGFNGGGGSSRGSGSELQRQLHEDKVIVAACAQQRSGQAQPVLRWLRAQGCAWSAECFTAAAGAGASEAQMAWMVGDGCPVPAGGEPYAVAAYHGDVMGLRALARLGCPWGPPGRAVARAIFFHGRGRAPLLALQEVLRLGCPVDWRRVLAAAQRRECRYNIADEQLMGWILEGEERCRRRAPRASGGGRLLGWALRVACCGGGGAGGWPDFGLFEGVDQEDVEEPPGSESEEELW
ncbi:hypothetical protein HYH02_010399 [Chlamydomonas schloesseri]|uniref:Ankyrin repeat domain-containing protein n=1 Tax=Chlamydomonas schloesseri TaxID=2026947 RepID=A0A835TAK6_9CHLO|nr:hypothetical protein HYH02_010399 [Chlamydomonas schloesseri]|eukprot:KAG2440521.1 hypothetical protein HYH02_010399 [Chlamydomonas schloesseri]